MDNEAISFRVRGRVQGVRFRISTKQVALSLNINGWVRNCEDGSVEGYAEGSQAAIDSLVLFLRRGPKHAEVLELGIRSDSAQGFREFAIRE